MDIPGPFAITAPEPRVIGSGVIKTVNAGDSNSTAELPSRTHGSGRVWAITLIMLTLVAVGLLVRKSGGKEK